MTLIPEFYENRVKTSIDIIGQDAIDCLTDAIKLLGDCVDELTSKQPEFKQVNLTNNLRKANSQIKCKGTHILLLGNCVDLLYASVLLLLTGYNGRALSCIRDANESFRYANSCLNNTEAATNWLDGKKPKKPKKYKYPTELEVDSNTEKILNVWGTHPQYESTMSAWISRERFSRPIDKWDRFFLLRDLAAICDSTCKGLYYVLQEHKDLNKKYPDASCRLKTVNTKLISIIQEVVELYHELVNDK